MNRRVCMSVVSQWNFRVELRIGKCARYGARAPPMAMLARPRTGRWHDRRSIELLGFEGMHGEKS